MATLTTALTHDEIEDLVGDISSATVSASSSTQVTFDLTYTGDDFPHADSLLVSGTFSNGGQLSGTVSELDFRSESNQSLLLISGLSLDYATLLGLLSNPDTFEDFVDHMGVPGSDDDNLEIGDDSDDDLHGGDDDDTILGGGGDDHIHGGKGDDHLDGGDGDDDTVYFASAKKIVVDLAAGTAKGEGKDTLANFENVEGTRGSDRISGDDDDNDLDGDDGNDKVFGQAGDDSLLGGRGNDHLDGGEGNDLVDGDDGNDKLFGQAGDDDLLGGRGNDHLDGGAGNDLLDGGDGNDKLTGGDGDDVIDGGDGNDNIIAGSGLNTILAGRGNDKITAGDDADLIEGGDGNDKVFSGGGDDEIYGDDGKDVIKAGDGNDYIDGGDGDDNMAGGAGDDTYVVSSSKDKVVEKAGEGNDTVIADGSFSLAKLANVENIELTGAANTSASGNAGNNTLTGNDGANTLTGGAGADVFVFDNLNAVDTITDFVSGTDLIALDDDVFVALAGSLDLSANFVTGTAAGDADDFLIFDDASGELYYDADANGAGEAVHFVTLTGGATLTSDDIVVI